VRPAVDASPEPEAAETDDTKRGNWHHGWVNPREAAGEPARRGQDGAGSSPGSGPSDARSVARANVLRVFQWVGGHADVWGIFEDPDALGWVIAGLADPWHASGVTAVVGVESRGFLLGGAVAARLGVGFHAVRKAGALFPGPKRTVEAGRDYRGNAHALSLRDTLGPGHRVVFVDDWAEQGAQAKAVHQLVLGTGANWLGASLIVDQLTSEVRSQVGPVTFLVTAQELGQSAG
jgi:adenine phosphoribosyltransferase